MSAQGGLIIFVGDRGARYSDREDWRDLIAEEQLKRNEVVALRRGSEGLVRMRADEVPELRELFEEVEAAAQPAPAPTPPPRPARRAARTEAPVPPPPPPVEPPAPTPAPAPAPSPAPPSPAPPAPSMAEVAAAHTVEAPLPPVPPRPAPPKPRVPVWAWVVGGVAVVGVALMLLPATEPTTPAEAGAEATSGEPVTVYVTRETRVRPSPQGTGNTPVATLGRGAALTGVWRSGVDGRTPWLEITEGPYTGAFAWGPNLTDREPPAFAEVWDSEAQVLQSASLRAGPSEDAVIYESVEPGQTVRIAGQLESGWHEVTRTSGGVGYLPPEVFTTPDVAESAGVDDVATAQETQIPSDLAYQLPSPPQRVPAPLPQPQSAPAPAEVAIPEVIGRPNWISTPTAGQLGRLIPQRVLEAGRGGRAVIECVVDGGGALGACRVVDEQPEGLDLGSAALEAAPFFRMQTLDRDGASVEGRRVRVPISYNVG